MGRLPLSISTYAPKWWQPDAKEQTAIRQFDHRHQQHLLRSNRVRDNLRIDPTSMAKGRGFAISIWELGHNRFFMDAELEGAKVYAKRVKKKVKKWKLIGTWLYIERNILTFFPKPKPRPWPSTQP